jgi:hypothetical protein
VISTHSGITHYVPSLMQVEPWDTYSFSETIVQLLDDSSQMATYISACQDEAESLQWSSTGQIISNTYSLT